MKNIDWPLTISVVKLAFLILGPLGLNYFIRTHMDYLLKDANVSILLNSKQYTLLKQKVFDNINVLNINLNNHIFEINTLLSGKSFSKELLDNMVDINKRYSDNKHQFLKDKFIETKMELVDFFK
ncbi:hypothetical protein M2T78_16680 [Elizabethkingia ursingii]|uniref:hypothetical protein n=1 Tax=Elizabethkingia ursingii TaxID=1756150 RepID=UPI002012F11C|nr:hypothetical protein [Elizabethkingia ursingii]MCL1665902.1 hypothetical protein [Elizabethkingia ursingii]